MKRLLEIHRLLAVQIAVIQSKWISAAMPDASGRAAICYLECADSALTFEVDAGDLASAQRLVAKARAEVLDLNLDWEPLRAALTITIEDLLDGATPAQLVRENGHVRTAAPVQLPQSASFEDTQPIRYRDFAGVADDMTQAPLFV